MTTEAQNLWDAWDYGGIEGVRQYLEIRPVHEIPVSVRKALVDDVYSNKGNTERLRQLKWLLRV